MTPSRTNPWNPLLAILLLLLVSACQPSSPRDRVLVRDDGPDASADELGGCGDGICDVVFAGESCGTCPLDCACDDVDDTPDGGAPMLPDDADATLDAGPEPDPDAGAGAATSRDAAVPVMPDAGGAAPRDAGPTTPPDAGPSDAGAPPPPPPAPPPPPPRVLHVARSPSLPVPDADGTGVADTATISAPSCLVASVVVTVGITHTYVGDLVVELESPDGTVVRLHDRTGDDTDDIAHTYPTTALPDGPGALGDFVGVLAHGGWTLYVADLLSVDVGSLDTWTLEVTCF